jgi:hypothetical protein
MTTYKNEYLVTGRSSGTFIGGNILGPWAVFGVWFSVAVLRGVPRIACTAASLVTLVLSQSRGSIAALLVGSTLALVSLPAASRAMRVGLTIAIILGTCLGLGVTQGILQQGDMQARFRSGFAVLFEGPSADRNFAGRVDGWSRATDLFAQHPLGTWGEPQVLLHDSTDNQYIDSLLQGSIPFAGALLFALIGTVWSNWARPGLPSLVALGSVTIAVNSLSAQPLSYSSIGMYWLVLGYAATARRLRSGLPAENRASARARTVHGSVRFPSVHPLKEAYLKQVCDDQTPDSQDARRLRVPHSSVGCGDSAV